MNDETYTFISTVKDRRITSRSARNKVSGAKTRKVTMPSDYDTPAQRKRRNGPVLTYNMDTPHTKKELDLWPEDLRTAYLRKIIDTYHPTGEALGSMLGVGAGTVSAFIRKHGLCNRIKATPVQRKDFERFCDMTDTEAILVEKRGPMLTGTEADIHHMLEAKDWVGEKKSDEPFVPTPTPTYDTMHFTFTGNLGMFYRAVAQGPLMHLKDGTFTFTVDVVRKEAN